MAKVNLEQALTVTAVQLLINEWANELDVNDGLAISALVTEDCVYNMGPSPRQGRAEIAAFYQARFERLSATPEGPPLQRHTLSNLLVKFDSDSEVSITFTLIYFSTAGVAAGPNHADPAAVADVRMKCRKESDDEWRISMFDSNQSFKRTLA